jgi:3-hydroxybutyryl-CoA dehydratase
LTAPKANISNIPMDNKIDELLVGLESTVSWTVSDGDLDAFISLSGDRNPLHIDQEYAIQNGFDAPVVHGLLICVKISGLIGMVLPGRRCLLVSEELEFPNPLYVNDCVEISAQIKKRHLDLKLIKLKIVAKKGLVTVARGNITCKILF